MSEPRFRSQGPYTLCVEEQTRVQLTVEQNGGTPNFSTAPTLQVFNPAGAVAATPTVTVRDKMLTADILASSLPSTVQMGTGWTLVWSMGITDDYGARPHRYRDEAAVRRYHAYPSVTKEDLLTYVPALREIPLDWDKLIDGAWRTVWMGLESRAKSPDLIVSSHSTHQLHLFETLYIACRAATKNTDEVFAALTADFRKNANDQWSSLVLRYDPTDSVTTGSATVVAAQPMINLF